MAEYIRYNRAAYRFLGRFAFRWIYARRQAWSIAIDASRQIAACHSRFPLALIMASISQFKGATDIKGCWTGLGREGYERDGIEDERAELVDGGK